MSKIVLFVGLFACALVSVQAKVSVTQTPRNTGGVIIVSDTKLSGNITLYDVPDNVAVGANNVTCGLCEAVVKSVQVAIKKGNSTVDALEAIVKALCKVIAILPIQKKECDVIVDDLDKIKNWIEQGLEPAQICNNLGFCPSTEPLTLQLINDWTAATTNTGRHYGDPKSGCESDEQAVQVQGVAGDFCSPPCKVLGTCPKDIPTGVTAKPECALQTSTGAKYCALICSPALPIVDQKVADAQCGTNASCKAISGVGLCTYDD